MGISLFGINHAETKRAKIHCKCRFEVSTISINPIVDSINGNKILGYLFSFKLDFKKGTIAHAMIETNFTSEDTFSKKSILHLNFNEKNETYFCNYMFPKAEYSNYTMNELVVKIVNLCNDATIFKPILSNEITINNQLDLALKKQAALVYL